MKLNVLRHIYSFTWEISWDLWEIWYELGQRGKKVLVGEANLKVDDYRCGKSTVMNTAGFAKCKTFKNLAPKYCQVIFFSAALVLYVKGVLFHLCFVHPWCFVFLFVEMLHSFTAACEIFTASNHRKQQKICYRYMHV